MEEYMFGAIIATVIGAILLVLGFVGCIVPVLPGPIIAVLALVAVSIVGGWTLIAPWILITCSIASIAVTILDNVLPARSAARAGAGKGGIWGSVVGMIVGSIVFPPFGVFIGAFLGAYAGELLFHPDNREAFRSALAVFKGTIGAIILKLAVTGVITVVFIRGAIRLFEGGAL
jgi:hypothetical protein